MKNKFKVPVLDRHSFYILKNGLFLVITMLAITMLYYNINITDASYATRLFFAQPLAYAMIEHTLITLNVIIGAALLCDAVIKSEKN